MSAIKPVPALHSKGESSSAPTSFPPPHRVDTLGGSVEVQWELAPVVTRHGLLAYFIDFLKTGNTWSKFVDSRPLTYSSPNAPLKAELLATMVYSILTAKCSIKNRDANHRPSRRRWRSGSWRLNICSSTA